MIYTHTYTTITWLTSTFSTLGLLVQPCRTLLSATGSTRKAYGLRYRVIAPSPKAPTRHQVQGDVDKYPRRIFDSSPIWKETLENLPQSEGQPEEGSSARHPLSLSKGTAQLADFVNFARAEEARCARPLSATIPLPKNLQDPKQRISVLFSQGMGPRAPARRHVGNERAAGLRRGAAHSAVHAIRNVWRDAAADGAGLRCWRVETRRHGHARHPPGRPHRAGPGHGRLCVRCICHRRTRETEHSCMGCT
jgi:hypothetical protein